MAPEPEPPPADPRRFVYRIDAEDRIAYVNEHWDEFARENDALYLLGSEVLDLPLWSFLGQPDVRYLYRTLVAQIRATGRSVTLPFRCDSPAVRRFMEMTMSRIEGAGIEFSCRILRLEPREPVALLDPSATRSDEFIRMCSWCKRIALTEESWAEVEEAIRRLDLFGYVLMPQITHSICAACDGRVKAELRDEEKVG